uniref:Putative secreted protein n=1 Tax=Amblyomma parvum TaxID=251391 RepID=A0A023G2A5_AMBPA
MQKLLFFSFLVTFACIQGKVLEDAPQAAGDSGAESATTTYEYKEFCKDLTQEQQLILIGCVSATNPKAEKVIHNDETHPKTLLEKICGNQGEASVPILEALESSQDALDNCTQFL